MITIGDRTTVPARPLPDSGLMVCPVCNGYGHLPMGIGEDDTDCDHCWGDGSVPGPMPSPLLCVRIDGWRSDLRTRLVYSGERLARGVDCRTQEDFGTLLRMYGMPT